MPDEKICHRVNDLSTQVNKSLGMRTYKTMKKSINEVLSSEYSFFFYTSDCSFSNSSQQIAFQFRGHCHSIENYTKIFTPARGKFRNYKIITKQFQSSVSTKRIYGLNRRKQIIRN